MKRLDDTTGLLYSELLQQCAIHLPIDTGISYTTKTVSGNKYIYLQYTVGSRKKEISLGPNSEALQAKIAEQKERRAQAKEDIAGRERLVAMAIKGGAIGPSATEARVIEALARSGVFLAGGVLIGSHAFSVYGNMLGVQWPKAAMKTQDVDVAAAEERIPVAVSKNARPLLEVLQEADLGFHGVPALDNRKPSTSYTIRGKAFLVDMLTPMVGKPRSEPVYLKQLNTYAEPLRFLDYLIEGSVPAVIVARAGILVNVPDPARFALHKLVVSVRRGTHHAMKSRKDVMQASQLLEVLIEERPGEIILAIDAALEMPDKFMSQLKNGAEQLPAELRETIIPMLK